MLNLLCSAASKTSGKPPKISETIKECDKEEHDPFSAGLQIGSETEFNTRKRIKNPFLVIANEQFCNECCIFEPFFHMLNRAFYDQPQLAKRKIQLYRINATTNKWYTKELDINNRFTATLYNVDSHNDKIPISTNWDQKAVMIELTRTLETYRNLSTKQEIVDFIHNNTYDKYGRS